MLAKPFQTYNLISYYGYTHACGIVYIPNIVHTSLDLRYTAFFYNYKFRERDDVGASCNTFKVEQIVCVLGRIVQIVKQSPKLACDISIVI